MRRTNLRADFYRLSQAKRALAALIDRGANRADLRLSGGELTWYDSAITTTTSADAALGANRGAAAGLLIGTAAAAACLWISGRGIVIGGGALPTALMSLVGTFAGGAFTGATAGLLHDLGPSRRARSAILTRWGRPYRFRQRRPLENWASTRS
jgi:hypothetical protein